MSGDEAALINQKLDQIISAVSEIKTTTGGHGIQLQNFEVWRAQIEARLASGSEHINTLQTELREKVDKRTVMAYLAGAAGGSALLMKLILGH